MQTPSSVVAALSVYAEPLVSDARVLIVGGVEPGVGASLVELGARSVHRHDPEEGELDVRDGAFDLAIVPDVGALRDPAAVIRRLRRVVDAQGAVVAMGCARTEESDEQVRGFPELAPAAVAYAELYDLFALQFENVTMTGVLPFAGVVFAELGASDDVAVSVDTSLAPAAAPGVFVVIASRDECALDPYAIVQVPAKEAPAPRGREREREGEAALAAAQLKGDLLSAQLDEVRARLAAAEARSADQAHHTATDRRAADKRVDHLLVERDAAATRAAELEGILAAAEQALGALEQRLVAADQQNLERDDQMAALRGELDALHSEGIDLTTPDPELLLDLTARAERAEAALALNVADLAHVAEAHASEIAVLEAQLRERARIIAAMDRELGRREQIVRELVTQLEEGREANGARFEVAPPLPVADPEEVARLRRKLDELSLEIARREGELVAQSWRIQELENAPPPSAAATPGPAIAKAGAPESDALARELSGVKDELDALRQALTQEHAARVAAESGEELSRARAELARQSALLEQMRGRGSQPAG